MEIGRPMSLCCCLIITIDRRIEKCEFFVESESETVELRTTIVVHNFQVQRFMHERNIKFDDAQNWAEKSA